jgi:hypothetical protein
MALLLLTAGRSSCFVVSGLLLIGGMGHQGHQRHCDPALVRRHSSKGAGSRLYAAAHRLPVEDLQMELDSVGLGLCHGILHASGVRRLSDIYSLTDAQVTNMGVDNFDRRILRCLMDDELRKKDSSSSTTTTTPPPILSTCVDGQFQRKVSKRFEAIETQDFAMQVISEGHDIFMGRLFTPEQCMHINRMAEYHAYRGIGTSGAGWTNELYTLTAQHMQCKDVPGLLAQTDHIFRQLQHELYSLFPTRICKGSIVFESDGEPHLVKYHGKAKGTEMHTDNSEFVYITVNVMLSEDNDYSGGGTYIKSIDKTIHLKQGEMLIHLGDLEHAGMDIESGVRRLLISFFACTWEKDELNTAKVGEARDYYDAK